MRRSLRLIGALVVVATAGLAVPLLDLGGSPGTPTPELGPAQTGSLRAAPIPAEAAAPAVVPQSREEIRFSFAPVVKRVAPAVVNVYATSRAQARSPFEGDPFFERFFGRRGAPRERSSLGSGVIVERHGLVITNNHVISGATEVKVALADGREYQAEILLRDERTDQAQTPPHRCPLAILPDRHSR